MKIMKKILLYIPILIFAFWSCDQMDEVYEDLDVIKPAYNKSIDYLFTADDYATASDFAKIDAVSVGDTDSSIAKQIGTMKAFNATYSAEDYVGKVIGDLYPEYNKNSNAFVTYDSYIGGLEYLDIFGNATSYELEDADYEAMGPAPAAHHNFAYNVDPEEYLPDWLLIKYPSAVADDVVAITYQYYDNGVSTLTDYYSFDGTEWSVLALSGVYFLTDDDYDAMGSSYGNFSSSMLPDDYLPTFLESTFIYAKAGDVKVVVYQYFLGKPTYNTVARAKEYHFDGSVWTEYTGVIEETNQFIHNGELWLFDPTITYALTGDDYQIMVDWVIANKDAEYIGYDSRRESYFGINAKYSSYSIYDGGYEGADFDTWQDAVKESFRLTNLLPQIFPDATTQVNGIDLYYNIVIGAYDGPTTPYIIRYQVTKAGPNPEFEYTEGPTKL
jgi:hypothetical protein